MRQLISFVSGQRAGRAKHPDDRDRGKRSPVVDRRVWAAFTISERLAFAVARDCRETFSPPPPENGQNGESGRLRGVVAVDAKR